MNRTMSIWLYLAFILCGIISCLFSLLFIFLAGGSLSLEFLIIALICLAIVLFFHCEECDE